MYYGYMNGHMGFMWFWWILGVVALVAIVWAVVYSARRLDRGVRHEGPLIGPPRADSAERLLKERYARGEIDDETYHRMLDELRA